MDEDLKDILKGFGGCAFIGAVTVVGVVWGVVAALKWAFS